MARKRAITEFAKNRLKQPRPDRISEVALPRREKYFPSPHDWQSEVLYFLLVDRFSDGNEDSRPLLDREKLESARRIGKKKSWKWDLWAQSGSSRWQGGTLKGIASKLGYLQNLGVTTLWISPVFKQRAHEDSYHGYAIQDFLEVDPRVGTRQDLVDLVAAAHELGMRVILDIIFNHSGANWHYHADAPGGEFMPHYTTERHEFGRWFGADGKPIDEITGPEDAVWPAELQDPERYTRAGAGDLGAGGVDDPDAEHKRTDFISLRDFDLSAPGLLHDLARCFKYWIALTDCDGFRLDTLKHVPTQVARTFCHSIKEFAANIGKSDFFLVGEIAGGDYFQDLYLDVLERDLNAALDIGEMRLALTDVALGRRHPLAYFKGFDARDVVMGSHRNIGKRHVSILDDHDHVFGEKVRFSSVAGSSHHVIVGVAIQFFTLGIPCLYYGTEQAFSGPPEEERPHLPYWGGADYYLREAMFGPEHPLKEGRSGLGKGAARIDTSLPGFGPFGTSGHHCFDESHPTFRRISALAHLRAKLPALRVGRQYLRPTSFLDRPFAIHGPGELIAWSRILDDEEVLCVVNPHGSESRGARIVVDSALNPAGSFFTVLINTAGIEKKTVKHRAGSRCVVSDDGLFAVIEVENLGPGEVLILCNRE